MAKTVFSHRTLIEVYFAFDALGLHSDYVLMKFSEQHEVKPIK